MSYPHDYYKFDPDHPELHNRGEGRPYLEPDWHSSGLHDAQLPALSAIGRGPRGEGLYVGAQVNQDGEISFTLNSTLTGEVVWTSPNLAPWDIEFVPTVWNDIVAGIPAALDIIQTRGNQTHTTHAYIPAGEEGSLVFVLNDTIDKRDDNTYTTTVADLTIYGKELYQNRPTPRPNDIIMCAYGVSRRGFTPEYGLAIGTIENVGGTTRENYQGRDEITPTNVVFTVNNYIPIPAGPKGDPGADGAGFLVIRMFYEDAINYVEDGGTYHKIPIDYDAYDLKNAMQNGSIPVAVLMSREHPEFVTTSISLEAGEDDSVLYVGFDGFDQCWVNGHDKFMVFNGAVTPEDLK